MRVARFPRWTVVHNWTFSRNPGPFKPASEGPSRRRCPRQAFALTTASLPAQPNAAYRRRDCDSPPRLPPRDVVRRYPARTAVSSPRTLENAAGASASGVRARKARDRLRFTRGEDEIARLPELTGRTVQLALRSGRSRIASSSAARTGHRRSAMPPRSGSARHGTTALEVVRSSRSPKLACEAHCSRQCPNEVGTRSKRRSN